jgi:uncharacterized damage-inducible protein DinB
MQSTEMLAELRQRFQQYQHLAEAALAQVADEDLHRQPGPQDNSLAILIQHMGGNLQSRFTAFLTSDGEKPWRHRDREFEAPGATREALMQTWERGWQALFAALAPLSDADLNRTVTVRGETHTVFQALQRQVTHHAYHTGQIVQLAKHWAGGNWQSLSIPRGQSEQFNRAKGYDPQAGD